ncbi:DNA glycosylase/AP lyase [Cunninghamella echinulata]|nr:DNA glycosylase/AP lyase [Cunninghamella echinulata]
MPEIAEVEHARRQCHSYCLSRKITKVEVVEDQLVFCNMTADSFAKYMKGKTVKDTKRWGKYFILLLDGDRHIVAHFGMTGSLKFKHELKENDTWPPRFWKTILTFSKSTDDKEPMVMAFCDPRRLGRIRLVENDPFTSEPISKLGFDPLHNLPDETEFASLITKRAMPIKALLLDQAFSAGVGNWIADEILYHSRIHPAQYTNTLTKDECNTLREQMLRVCKISVEAEADESLFPENWLMTYRWNKGKGKGKGVLPNGHKLAFETVND